MDANNDGLDQFKDTDQGMGIPMHNITCSFVFSLLSLKASVIDTDSVALQTDRVIKTNTPDHRDKN